MLELNPCSKALKLAMRASKLLHEQHGLALHSNTHLPTLNPRALSKRLDPTQPTQPLQELKSFSESTPSCSALRAHAIHLPKPDPFSDPEQAQRGQKKGLLRYPCDSLQPSPPIW